MVQPGVELILNVLSWMRITAGGYYRYVSGSGTPGLGDAALSGPGAQIGLEFGYFGNWDW